METNKNVVILTSSSNCGIGLWTSICVFFCGIFGIESKAYRKKQSKVVTNIKLSIRNQFENLEGEYELRDFRITWNGNLSATASTVASK